MLEMATGEAPWSHLKVDNNMALMVHIGRHPTEHPLVPSPEEFSGAEFVLSCFAADPKDRPLCGQLLHSPFLKDVLQMPVLTVALCPALSLQPP